MGGQCPGASGVQSSREEQNYAQCRNQTGAEVHRYIHVHLFISTVLIVTTGTFPYAVKSFIDLVTYLFSLPGLTAFLSERISQDPLEKFFGLQRQRGRVNENPDVSEFCKNTQAHRVINKHQQPHNIYI